jgi:NADH dehydrogenase
MHAGGFDSKNQTRPFLGGSGMSSPAKRVLILGGGHSGVYAAYELIKRKKLNHDIEIVMVNHDNVELWHGMIPQIVSSIVQPQHAVSSLREVLPGVVLYTYAIEHIDLVKKLVTLDSGHEGSKHHLAYDFLLIALGSVTNLSRFPGLAEHGLQMKTLGDVVHLRNHVLDVLEQAAVEKDPATKKALLTIVVAGAGFAGVEVSCHINAMMRDALRFYPSIQASEIRVIDVTNGTRILPQLSAPLAAAGLQYMQSKNVEVRFNSELVSGTGTAAIFSNGEQISTRTIVVTIGVGPNPLVQSLPVQFDRGRIMCDEFCQVVGFPGVFAAGDNAAITDPKTGQMCPATALASFVTGASAGRNIVHTLKGEPLERFAFNNVGEVTLLGPNFGLVQLYGVRLTGSLASILGSLSYLAYIPTWESRFKLLLDWMMAKIFPRNITQLKISRTDGVIPMRFAPNDVVVREGEPGSRFYVVTGGQVEVVRRAPDGSEIRLAQLGPGQYFGEVALMRDTRRTATVRAVTETTVLSMAKQDFSTLVTHMSALRDTFEKNVPARALAPAAPPP